MASEHDAIRDEILSREGIEVLHISDQDIGNLPILISNASPLPSALQGEEPGGEVRETDARFMMNLDDGVMVNSSALGPLLEPQ